MKIEPLFSQVVLEKHERETKTESGIVLMDVGSKNTIECRVVAVGPGAIGVVAVDDLVIFNKYQYADGKATPTAAETVVDGKPYFIVYVDSLLGRLVE